MLAIKKDWLKSDGRGFESGLPCTIFKQIILKRILNKIQGSFVTYKHKTIYVVTSLHRDKLLITQQEQFNRNFMRTDPLLEPQFEFTHIFLLEQTTLVTLHLYD